MILDAITSTLGYSTFIPRGDGRQVRDFIFIEDVVELYLAMASQRTLFPEKFLGDVFNAGTNSPRSMRDVIEEIYTLCGNEHDLHEVLALMKDKRTIGEIDCQFMDFEKVNHHFGWSPGQDFRQGLTKTIEWFTSYHQRISEDDRR